MKEENNDPKPERIHAFIARMDALKAEILTYGASIDQPMTDAQSQGQEMPPLAVILATALKGLDDSASWSEFRTELLGLTNPEALRRRWLTGLWQELASIAVAEGRLITGKSTELVQEASAGRLRQSVWLLRDLDKAGKRAGELASAIEFRLDRHNPTDEEVEQAVMPEVKDGDP